MDTQLELPLAGRVRLHTGLQKAGIEVQVNLSAPARDDMYWHKDSFIAMTDWFDLAKWLPAHSGRYLLRYKNQAKGQWDKPFEAMFNAQLKTWAAEPFANSLFDVNLYEFRGLVVPVGSAGRVRLQS